MAIASLKADRPAILKLISEESTAWNLPSTSVDLHVDDRVAEDAAVLHRLGDALLDRGDELPGDGAADDLVDELEAAARSRGSTWMMATPNWPWPPVCFLYLPSASAACR